MNDLTRRRRAAVRAALVMAREVRKQNPVRAWEQLERAHILSQPDAGLHVCVHVVMLRLALHMRDVREVLAQLLRLPLAAPASWLGRYPVGNPGTGRVGAFAEVPVPADIVELLSDTRSGSHRRY